MSSTMPKLIQEFIEKGELDKDKIHAQAEYMRKNAYIVNVFYTKGYLDAHLSILNFLRETEVVPNDKEVTEFKEMYSYIIINLRNALKSEDYEEASFYLQTIKAFEKYLISKFASFEILAKIEKYRYEQTKGITI